MSIQRCRWRTPKRCCTFAAGCTRSLRAVSPLGAMCVCNAASSGRTVSSPACIFATADECLRRSLPTRMTESAIPESYELALIVAEMEMKTVFIPPMVVCIMDIALVEIAKAVEAAAG